MTSMNDKPDETKSSSRIKELRDWVDVGFKLILATLGVMVGYYFSFQKQQNEDVKLVVDMTTSEQQSKRLLGWSITEAYKNQNRIPQELYVAVFKYANNNADQGLRNIVNNDVAVSAKDDQSLQKAVKAVDLSLPIRVYFHVPRREDVPRAAEIERIVETSLVPNSGSIVVPGIEVVPRGPNNTILKCFRKAECATIGPQLLKVFADAGVQISLSDQSAVYEKSPNIRPKHFEAWFVEPF